MKTKVDIDFTGLLSNNRIGAITGSSMRTLTTLLAIAALALHLLLGCCWHHAHGGSATAEHHHAHDGAHVHLPSWLWAGADDHCHHHEHEHGDSDKGETTPHAPCSDPQCVYLVVSQLTPPAANDLVWPSLTFEQLVPAESLVVAAFEFAGQQHFSPHVRRHLALNHFLN